MLILSRADVEQLVTLPDAIAAVEEAFVDLATQRASLFPVIRERIDPHGGFFGVKSGYLASAGVLGYKGGGFWAGNRAKGVAAHQSVILLYDPETGRPEAMVDGNYITIIRTGAVGAIAARVLARPDSQVVAVIGAGAQGDVQVRALREVLPIVRVRVFDCDRRCAEDFPVGIVCDSVEEAVSGADIVITATPSFEAIVKRAWIVPGTHINAFGADTRGKQELDVELVANSKLVVDYLPQAREIGESQHAFRAGRIDRVHAELGDILAGKACGRQSAEEITIFDATGIALQDLAVASVAVCKARDRGIGVNVVLD